MPFSDPRWEHQVSVFPKNDSHFQYARELYKHPYIFDFFKLIPIWEAVSKLGAEFPSSYPRKRLTW